MLLRREEMLAKCACAPTHPLHTISLVRIAVRQTHLMPSLTLVMARDMIWGWV